MSQLRECPFCGEQPKHNYAEGFDNNSIGCANIECEFQPCTNKHYSTKQAAEMAWNTRHPQQDVQGLVTELKRAMAEAAVCLLTPNYGICDTIWLEKGNCTLYEHLVSYLDVEVTGDVDKDINALKSYQEGRG